MSVNPGIPLPTYNDGKSPESRAEPTYINGASGTTATLNGGGEFMQLRNRSYIFVASMLGSLVIFWAPLQRLLQFAGNSEFSYIPLIPAISAFLIVMRSRPIFRESKPNAVAGAMILTSGILLVSLTSLFQAAMAQDRLWLPALGIVATWWGLFICCYGLQSARAAMLPLGLLLFMLPAPSHIADAVIGFLQHWSAALSYSLFRIIGVPAVREGMVISLPRLNIEVAPECSGIRSSISLLILTLAGANLYLRSGWNKTLLVFLLAPLCILRNAVRIVTLSTLALYVDRGFLNGSLHHKGGILFFFLAIGFLIPIVLIMQWFERPKVSSGIGLPEDVCQIAPTR